MSSPQCFFKLSCVFCVSYLLFFCCLKNSAISPFTATISVSVLSTIFILLFAKRKAITHVQSLKNTPERATEDQKQSAEICDIHEYQVESTDFPSGSETSDDCSATENFELNWSSFNNVGKIALEATSSECSVSCSDNDEDEDDNLIEISFPDNKSSELIDEPKLQADLPPEAMFRQDGFMELFAEINEVNEEDSLIEIDLSMGSIKGSGI